MHFQPCTLGDLDEIFRLYRQAIAFQKTKTDKIWGEIAHETVKSEINEGHKWKITINRQMACVFAITFSDPVIWGEKNNNPAVYLHRIAVNPAFRGYGFVKSIVEWCRKKAPEWNIDYIRLDTAAGNHKLIAYYQKNGFAYLGDAFVAANSTLPGHYQNASFALLEIAL